VSRSPWILALLLITACGGGGDEETATGDCGEHGEMDDDHGHCHCDEGYELSEDGDTCVEGGGLGKEPPTTTLPTDTGSGTGGTPSTDTGLAPTDTAVPTTDTAPMGDPFDPTSTEASLHELSDGSQAWLLLAKDGKTWLSIENYEAYGGATGPETRSIDAVDTSYATCGMCLLLQTGCEPHGDHAHCEVTYMPEPGGVVVTDALGGAAGETWSGSLEAVRFVEVTIGFNNNTTVVKGGDSFYLADWAFSTVLAAP